MSSAVCVRQSDEAVYLQLDKKKEWKIYLDSAGKDQGYGLSEGKDQGSRFTWILLKGLCSDLDKKWRRNLYH